MATEVETKTIRLNVIDESGYGVQTRIYKVRRTKTNAYIWQMAAFPGKARHVASWLAADNVPFTVESNSNDTRIVNISETDMLDVDKEDVDEREAASGADEEPLIASWGEYDDNDEDDDDDDDDGNADEDTVSVESDEKSVDNTEPSSASTATEEPASIPANVLREKNSD
jgi:hypothetical protein